MWKETIDVSAIFHNDDLSLTQKSEKIIEIMKNSQWLQENPASPDEYLDNIGEWLEDFEWAATGAQSRQFTVEEFDSYWDAMYDLADRDRVWVNTH